VPASRYRTFFRGKDLENVVCVVTRYYDGTDLGIGGLVRAYGNATKAAIDAADAVVERPHERVTVTAEYDDSGTVRAILESDYVEFDAAYEETVTFDIRVPTTDVEALCDRLRSATSGRARIE
jgi:putative IMPACT (imprinted ancient) family translation regulator